MIIKKNLKLTESITLDSILNERMKEIKQQKNIEILKENVIVHSELNPRTEFDEIIGGGK